MNETPTEDGAPVSQTSILQRSRQLRHALSIARSTHGQSGHSAVPHAAVCSSHSCCLIVSYYTNRGFLGWGLLFILGVLVVPVGRTRAFLLGFIPYAGVWFIFTALRSLADETIFARTVNLYVPDFERKLFNDRLPSVWLQDRFYTPGHPGPLDYFMTGVHWSYFIVPHVFAVYIWYKRPELFLRFFSAMTLMLAMGLAIYFLIPTNPPWLAPEPINSPSAAVVYRVMESVGKELGGGIYEASYRVIGESNPRAAMPSIHLAFTALAHLPGIQVREEMGLSGGDLCGDHGICPGLHG